MLSFFVHFSIENLQFSLHQGASFVLPPTILAPASGLVPLHVIQGGIGYTSHDSQHIRDLGLELQKGEGDALVS